MLCLRKLLEQRSVNFSLSQKSLGISLTEHHKIWSTKRKQKSTRVGSGECLGRAILHLGLDNTSIENKVIQPRNSKLKVSAQLWWIKMAFPTVKTPHGLLESICSQAKKGLGWLQCSCHSKVSMPLPDTSSARPP